MYNIHPILVHFPIAFLLLYSLLKIIPFHIRLPHISWREIQQIVLTVGLLGALAANATGEIAEHIAKPNHQIVEMHALFATMSILIYGLIFIGEFLFILNPYLRKKLTSKELLNFFNLMEKLLTNRAFTLILALLGIISISLTGLLGGIMVYGTSADPFAPLILKLLGIQQ